MTYKNIGAKYVTVDAKPGASIDRACEEAIRLAGELGALVTFRFNGVDMACDPWDKVDDRVKFYLSK